MKTFATLTELLSWWSGGQFDAGRIDDNSSPKVYCARDGRRCVVAGVHWASLTPGDSIRLATGGHVELAGRIGCTRTWQVWNVRSDVPLRGAR